MDPKQLANVERWNLVVAGVFTLIAALLFDRPVLLGVLVGSLLSCANFYSVHRLMVRSLRTEGTRRAGLQLLLVAKMGILLLLIFLAMKYLPLSPIALAVGLSVFLVSIAAESIRFACGHRVDNGRA